MSRRGGPGSQQLCPTCPRRPWHHAKPCEYVQLQINGELIVWERGRTNFALLQRRVTAGRALLRLVHDFPAHYVLFDLLAGAGGEVVLGLPLSERRARLERLLVDAPTQLTLTPQTTDTQQVSDWLVNWTVAAGIEGVL
ncbi:hypothetical protein ACFYPW_31020 [Micromonospora zamorensis]|uniref:ATP-dependent DNA ligase n=1 Tax=Micromonospora zamorensis TaxID=709883 RepID=UPI0036CC6E0A